MASAASRPSVPGIEPAAAPVPPLEAGDRLSRAEFERRYNAMPGVKKAELIERTVHMPSPVSVRRHGDPHGLVLFWLNCYRMGTPGLIVADNTSVRLDPDNMPQPDALLMRDPAQGGQARISDDDLIEGAPELVAEVASSSVSYDLHDKLRAYRRAGVREYVVWRVADRAIDWFVLRDDEYVAQAPDAEGVLRSAVFPGLWLDAAALIAGDLARVLAAVQRGLAAR
jgi:Uma2 family endonuclease